MSAKREVDPLSPIAPQNTLQGVFEPVLPVCDAYMTECSIGSSGSEVLYGTAKHSISPT